MEEGGSQMEDGGVRWRRGESDGGWGSQMEEGGRGRGRGWVGEGLTVRYLEGRLSPNRCLIQLRTELPSAASVASLPLKANTQRLVLETPSATNTIDFSQSVISK